MTADGNRFAAVDAVVLVGGKGTRLRPLTISAAKPMLPTAGVPFLAHLLSRIRAAGMTHVVLGTSYRAETFAEYFGRGERFGLDIDYVVEDVPLGTGGAIRNVASRLRGDTAMIFNGDILSGADLGSLMRTHDTADADVTLHLVRVTDPSRFGSVPTDGDGRVTAFVEKSDNPPTDQINAGCYVFRREIVEAIPAGRVVSVERETFPGLLAAGARVQGHVDASYWLDLGTPASFVRGSADLVQGLAPTDALPGAVGIALVLPGAHVHPDAVIEGGSAAGAGAVVAARARVDGSVLFNGAQVGEGAEIVRSVLGHGAIVGAGAVVVDAVIGDGAHIGARCELTGGIRVWPSVRIPAGGVRFSADV
jgi:mannose-1-phosphate guanylyltransferase